MVFFFILFAPVLQILITCILINLLTKVPRDTSADTIKFCIQKELKNLIHILFIIQNMNFIYFGKENDLSNKHITYY